MTSNEKFLVRTRTCVSIFIAINGILSGLACLGCSIAYWILRILSLFRVPVDEYITTTSSFILYFLTWTVISVLIVKGIEERKGYTIDRMIISILYIVLLITFECVAFIYMDNRKFAVILSLGFCFAILYLQHLTFKQTEDDRDVSDTNGDVVPPAKV